MVSFIVDILLAVTAAVIIIFGWKNGVVKGIISFAVNIVSLIVAYAFTPMLSAIIYDNFILQKISSGIEKTVASLAKSGDGYDIPKLAADMPDVLSGMLSKYRIENSSFSDFASKLTESGDAALRKVSDFIASPISTIISNVVSFIIIFFVALIILKLATLLIIALFKAPVLKTADRLAGFILGVVNALIVLWILSFIISHGITALGSIAPDHFGAEVVERSVILHFFSSYNPLGILKNVISSVG